MWHSYNIWQVVGVTAQTNNFTYDVAAQFQFISLKPQIGTSRVHYDTYIYQYTWCTWEKRVNIDNPGGQMCSYIFFNIKLHNLLNSVESTVDNNAENV